MRSDRAAALSSRLSILARLQLGLEALYRVETRLQIDVFTIDAATRAAIHRARAPREQLLISQDGGDTVAINARCLDDVDLDALTIQKWDGKSH